MTVGVAFDGTRISGAETLTDGGNWDEWQDSKGGVEEADFVYQGDGSISIKVSATTGGVELDPSTISTDMTAPNKVVLSKINITTYGLIDTTVVNGVMYAVGSGQSDNYLYYLYGSNNDYPFVGGWQLVVIDPNIAQYRDDVVGSPDLSGTDYFGLYADITAGVKAENIIHDAVDVFTSGEGHTLSGSTGSFQDFADYDEGVYTNRYGIVTTREGIFYVLGTLTIGSSSVDSNHFVDSNSVIVFPTARFGTGFAGLRFNLDATGSNYYLLSNEVFIGKGTITGSVDTRPDYETTGSNGSVTFDGVTFNVFRNINANEQALFSECIFISGSKITQSGSEILSCSISQDTQPTGSAFIRSDNLSNIGKCNFTYNAGGHAIEIYKTGSFDFYNNTFNDYLASDTSGSAIFNNSSGSVTINVVGGTAPTIRNGAGSSTTLIINPVTFSVRVQDISDTSDIENARVLVWVTNNDNYFYQAGVAITGSGTTATVVHNSHGLSTGDSVIIEGAEQDVYNGAYQVTVVDSNSYTYTTNETIVYSPASGSTVSTFAVLNGLTDVSGTIDDLRSWGSSQAISGRVRKSSSSPYYQPGPVVGTINNTSGLALTVQLVGDE